jgi:hypothetical protein
LSPQASPLISLTRSAKPIAFEADAGKVLQPRRNKTEQKKGIDFMEDDDQLPPWLAGNPVLDAGDDEENRPTPAQRIGACPSMYAPPPASASPPTRA